MQGAPEKKNGEDGLPLPPYAVYNIGGGTPENLLDYISTLQEELVNAGVLPSDYDFEGHRELVGMQPGDVPVTYADSSLMTLRRCGAFLIINLLTIYRLNVRLLISKNHSYIILYFNVKTA